VDEDEGASCFLAHNLKPEAPSPSSGGPCLPSSSPLKSEEPHKDPYQKALPLRAFAGNAPKLEDVAINVATGF
jgi:hypothetical protein